MELWHTQDAGSDHTRESTHQTRILTSTSGNAQNYATDSKSHLDFREPSANNNRAVSEPQYQLSVPIVGSNDKQALHDRLAQHKARRSSHPQHRLFYDRPYLRNPKYLAYRARNRYEVGKDGKPIWPDFMEESFQNGKSSMPHAPILLNRRSNRSHTANGSPQEDPIWSTPWSQRAYQRVDPARDWRGPRPQASLKPYTGGRKTIER